MHQIICDLPSMAHSMEDMIRYVAAVAIMRAFEIASRALTLAIFAGTLGYFPSVPSIVTLQMSCNPYSVQWSLLICRGCEGRLREAGSLTRQPVATFCQCFFVKQSNSACSNHANKGNTAAHEKHRRGILFGSIYFWRCPCFHPSLASAKIYIHIYIYIHIHILYTHIYTHLPALPCPALLHAALPCQDRETLRPGPHLSTQNLWGSKAGRTLHCR